MRRRWLAIAVILTVPSGCDNVAWGGVDVRLQAPRPQAELRAASDRPADTAPEDTESLPELPGGPILLAGTRDGSEATLVVVGTLEDEGLEALPAEAGAPDFRRHFTRTLLNPGTELVLFAEGVRVGGLQVRETGVDESFCVPRPTVRGVVELVPDASDARRFLALPAGSGFERNYEDYRSLNHDYDQRVASLNLASAAIPRLGAAWPPSLLEARADIQAFRLPEAPAPSIAATFLFNDRLAVADPGQRAYSLFIMGTGGSGGHQASYVAYRPAEEEGKGAPRYFNHLDWDRDGETEVLLDVFGARGRWFAALGRRDGSWARTFEDSCRSPGG